MVLLRRNCWRNGNSMENTEKEHTVWIPSLHRDLTGGVETVAVAGATVRAVVAELDARFPGIYDRLCEEGRLRPYVSLAVNGVIETRGLRTRLDTPSEIHFVPALGGGG